MEEGYHPDVGMEKEGHVASYAINSEKEFESRGRGLGGAIGGTISLIRLQSNVRVL